MTSIVGVVNTFRWRTQLLGGAPLSIHFSTECLPEALQSLRGTGIDVPDGVVVKSHPDVSEYTCRRDRMSFSFRARSTDGHTQISFGGASFRGLKLQCEAFAALESLGIEKHYGGEAIFMYDEVDD